MHTSVLEEKGAAEATERLQASNESGALSPALLAILLVWPLLVAGVAGTYVLHTLRDEAASTLAQRPPIAVLDPHAYIERQPVSESTDARMQAGFRQANAAAAKLRDAGFLILDRGIVMSAPETIKVPTASSK